MYPLIRSEKIAVVLPRAKPEIRNAQRGTRTRIAFDRSTCPIYGSGVKASVYYGKGDIRVESVPDPEVKNPTDAIVQAAMDSRSKIKVMVKP